MEFSRIRMTSIHPLAGKDSIVNSIASVMIYFGAIVGHVPGEELEKLFWMTVILLKVQDDIVWKSAVTLNSKVVKEIQERQSRQEFQSNIIGQFESRRKQIQTFEKDRNPDSFTLYICQHLQTSLLDDRLCENSIEILVSLYHLSSNKGLLAAHLLVLVPFCEMDTLTKSCGTQVNTENLLDALLQDLDMIQIQNHLSWISGLLLKADSIKILRRIISFLYTFLKRKPSHFELT